MAPRLLVLLLGVSAGATAVAAEPGTPGAGVPPGTEVIRLSGLPGKLGAVRFTHAAHAARYLRPDGATTRCTDCHHALAGDEPASANARARMRCGACHCGPGEAPRIVDGRRAGPIATLKADGAVDYRSILFHTSCWACHKKIHKNGQSLLRCKLCHERGVSAETMGWREAPARGDETSPAGAATPPPGGR